MATTFARSRNSNGQLAADTDISEAVRVELPGLRVVPNATMLGTEAWDEYFGELVQVLFEAGSDMKLRVELDGSERQVEPEERVGASGLEGVALFLLGLGVREAERLVDRAFDAAVEWVRRHRHSYEEVSVKIYGPDGEMLKSVLVEHDGSVREWP